ncbi:MAG: hypothetical protein E5V21_27165, partial [Mesorhizobium sp.]
MTERSCNPVTAFARFVRECMLSRPNGSEIRQRYDAVMNEQIDTVTLWRPVGPEELKLIEKSGMRAFPPRLPEQPIFYPVLSEAYA